jgi:pimeloyl-ACP methyl ester carboxylesterase
MVELVDHAHDLDTVRCAVAAEPVVLLGHSMGCQVALEEYRGLWGNLPPHVALRVALLTGEVDTAAIVPEDLLPYMRHMVDIDLPMFLRMLRSAGEHSARDLLPKIDVPVLVLAGDRDSFTPTRYAEEMAALIPKAELHVLPGTHVIPIERKEQIAELVTRFVRKLREPPCPPGAVEG